MKNLISFSKQLKNVKTLIAAFIVVLFSLETSSAQDNQIPLIGSKAPSFTAESTHGKITFPEDFGNNWKILFSHPQDFTPVCTSELLELAYMHDDFDDLGIKVAVISTDEVKIHNLWKAHIEELDYKNRGPQKVHFPIIDDHKAEASETYGMLHEPTSTNRDIRGVFVLDSDNTVRAVNFYPIEIGRNFHEILRMVKALKTTDEQKVFTPANWKEGGDVLVPYFPYTAEQLEENPDITEEFYSVGNRLWFKKIDY